MGNNGLSTFSLHTSDSATNAAEAVKAVRAERVKASFAQPTLPEQLAGVDPETAARRHLAHTLASPALPTLTAPSVNGTQSEFRLLSTEAEPLTSTTIVKFRQTYQKVPVYGSLVTVELDSKNEMLAIRSALGTPTNVDPVATIAPAQALAALRSALGESIAVAQSPRLCFYFDPSASRWRLAYIFEDVRIPRSQQRRRGVIADFVFDAHNGSLVAELPRTAHVQTAREAANGVDELGKNRSFQYSTVGNDHVLVDEVLNVHTHDFGFGDIELMGSLLPGRYVTTRDEWPPSSVSAHANATHVAQYLLETLKRRGIDGKGGRLVSSINCIVGRESSDKKQWANAAWIGTQMVYGQKLSDGKLVSFAAGLDVVAHEIFHGVTDHTSRLQYVGQSGALNESYSDVFGVLMSNETTDDRATWNWQMGEDLDPNRRPLRNLSRPTAHGQPAHMSAYVQLPHDEWNDWGGVHINSGIPNFAAYKIMTAKKGDKYLFSASDLAKLFYLAVTRYLSRTSQFSDARAATTLVAETLFRDDAHRDEKVAAIETAFTEVGIQ